MSNENRIYQISCPNCHHEWSYNRNYYAQRIKQLGQEIEEINNQISANKRIESRRNKEWERNAINAKNIKLKQLQELKEIRAQYDIESNMNIYNWFKQLVKEEIGEKRYMELIEQADKEARAYSINTIAKTTYSRKGGEKIISVTKI